MTIELAQKQLQSVACPSCRKSALEVTLRCDLEPHSCTMAACCGNCGMTFQFRDAQPSLSAPSSAHHCVDCGSELKSVGIRCDLSSQEIFEAFEACATCEEDALKIAA